MIITKIFNFLGYLAKIPIKDEDGHPAEMNLYQKAMDTLVEKNIDEEGDKPDWLKKIEMVFHWGKKIAIMVDKIGEGKIPEIDLITDLMSMNMMSMNEFTEMVMPLPSTDDMLI
jgi:hypothetical protein